MIQKDIGQNLQHFFTYFKGKLSCKKYLKENIQGEGGGALLINIHSLQISSIHNEKNFNMTQ